VLKTVSLVFLLAGLLGGQAYAPGPQVLTFFSEVDDSDQPYGLYLPRDFDSSKKYPLVISLHGAYSNHRLNLRRVFGKGNRPGETDGEASRYFPSLPGVNYIVATPFARGTMGYQGIAEKDVYDVLADVKKRFPIDENRIYLTGLSMGGGGALWLGLSRPDLWAAIAPVCPAVPRGAEELAPNAVNLGVHLFHGDLDSAVPVAVSRRWHKKLMHLDTTVEYIEFPGVKHNSWDRTYKNGAIFDWFARFRRPRHPDRVRFVSRYYKHRSAYWVQLDGLRPGEPASIDARFIGKNRLEIQTSRLDGFALRLAGHPMFLGDRPVEVKLDDANFKLKPEESLSFSKVEEEWRAARYVLQAGNKRPGLEGPIREAVSGRHLYAYGTGGAPDEEELKRRREQALAAADWRGPRTRLLLSLRAVADKDVREQDLRGANLVLFGTKETNSLIARFAHQLPLELNAGAADYGLVFVAPAGDRYVLVNSGLPWWTGAEQAKRHNFRFMRSPYQVLLSFGDFILFKGSLTNVIAEGYFDQAWKVPPAAAARMGATGAVQIR
jgi:pimeloyl-ACP methyl ester carboxylesterase